MNQPLWSRDILTLFFGRKVHFFVNMFGRNIGRCTNWDNFTQPILRCSWISSSPDHECWKHCSMHGWMDGCFRCTTVKWLELWTSLKIVPFLVFQKKGYKVVKLMVDSQQIMNTSNNSPCIQWYYGFLLSRIHAAMPTTTSTTCIQNVHNVHLQHNNI